MLNPLSSIQIKSSILKMKRTKKPVNTTCLFRVNCQWRHRIDNDHAISRISVD